MTRPKWVALSLVVLGIVVVVTVVRRGDGPEAAWISFLGGDPHAGGRVFFDKGCNYCHSISGTGGHRASDLGRVGGKRLSAGELVGVMWNHAPEMWKAIEETGIEFPSLNQQEITDLFAYLYLVRYLDEPGDQERGEQLLSDKQCLRCHALGGRGARIGPPVEAWGTHENPLLWAQQMWNHATAMYAAMEDRGITWPEFEDQEMVDLLCYIRSVSTGPRQPMDFLPANPRHGRRLFAAKGCDRCHAIRGKGGDLGPDLGRAPESAKTITQVAGTMWNHSPEMWKAMEEKHLPRPTFTRVEMADLLAYLYASQYFDEPGDPTVGRQIFSEKQCVRCHRLDDIGEARGPSISGLRGRISPMVMAYVVWRHGPGMYRKMQESGTAWPLFKGREMADLLAFLNRRM